jgi:hypothetical protein
MLCPAKTAKEVGWESPGMPLMEALWNPGRPGGIGARVGWSRNSKIRALDLSRRVQLVRMSAALDIKPEIIFPSAGHHSLVQCVGYRGLAYQNSAGQWRTLNSNKRLPQPVEIILQN